MGTSGYQWVPVYQVPVYQVYQEDQDQISVATYISDVVHLTRMSDFLKTSFLKASLPDFWKAIALRLWPAYYNPEVNQIDGGYYGK